MDLLDLYVFQDLFNKKYINITSSLIFLKINCRAQLNM